MVALDEIEAIHPEENMDVCTNIHGNPSNTYRDISLWTDVVDTAFPKATS